MVIKKKLQLNNKVLLSVLVALLFLLSFITTGSALARYSSVNINNYGISSLPFYFSSDELTQEGASGGFDDSIVIYIYNFEDLNNSGYDIAYSISVSDIITSGSTVIDIADDNSGMLTGGVSDTSTVTVTPHADIQSFKITVTTTNGYEMVLSKTYTKN